MKLLKSNLVRQISITRFNMQTQPTLGFATKVVGVTSDYSKTANSDVVVITSGLPRKPGMTREDLIGVNAGIVNSVVASIIKESPNAILVIVSNPMDTMTYLTFKTAGLPKNRVIGMGGALDSSRFTYFLSQALNTNGNNIEAMVIGGHGDTTMNAQAPTKPAPKTAMARPVVNSSPLLTITLRAKYVMVQNRNKMVRAL